MAVIYDLAQRLATLSQDEPTLDNGARILSDGGLPGPLQSMLREIDQTVLTRELEFRFEGLGSVVAVASGRRLLGFRAFKGDGIASVADKLIERPLSKDDEEALSALETVLQPIDEMRQQISVLSRPGDRIGSQTELGLSADMLAEFLAIRYPFNDPTTLERLQAMSEDLVQATLIRMSDGDEKSFGDAASTKWLSEQSLGQLDSQDPAAGVPKMSILGQIFGERTFLAEIVDTTDTMICLLSGDNLSKFSLLYHQIYGDADR